MKLFLGILGLIGILIGLHFFYWFLVVPFHYKMANKMNCDYDPKTNRYVRREVKSET